MSEVSTTSRAAATGAVLMLAAAAAAAGIVAVRRSGFDFGLYCVGSSIGLMVMLLARGAMSVTGSCIVATVILVVTVAPSAVPGLT